MKNLVLLLVAMLLVNYLQAQSDPVNVWNWPEDRATAEEQNVLYTDNLKSELYAEAVAPLEYLIGVAPNLNPSLYINGAKIYEALADQEEEEREKLKFQERALEMYDLRIKYFNDEAQVLNRQAYTAYKYYKSTKEKYEELKTLFDKAFELNGEEIYDNNLIAYVDVIRRLKLTGGYISDNEVLDIYATVTDLIDRKLKNGGNQERLTAIADNVDKVLAATITVDCNFVESNLGPKLEQNPNDDKLAKKIFQLMLTGKCTDSPLALQAAEIVHKKEASYGLAKFIATRSQLDKNFSKAVDYYNQAIRLADSQEKKAEIYFDLAKLYAAKGDKAESRSSAYRAVKEDPSLKDAYALIGNLYMTSYEGCKQGISRIQDRIIFIAAYEMYSKADDYAGMANAKAQFPSMEEIFNEGKELGDSMNVGCWVNETVHLDRRPAN